MADPRLELIKRRLDGVKKVVAVSSGKGGVGKSMIAATLALSLRRKGGRGGLLDLDFTSPSTHLILGVEGLQPREEYGIIPPLAHDLRYLSIVFYALDKPAPLRGAAVSDAIIELLAITRWGELDHLIVDMPPGIGDATLDMIRLIPRIRFLLVTTPSRVAFETVAKLHRLLMELEIPVVGVVENMVMRPSSRIQDQVKTLGSRYLGSITYDSTLEETLGDVTGLMETEFSNSVKDIASNLERSIDR